MSPCQLACTLKTRQILNCLSAIPEAWNSTPECCQAVSAWKMKYLSLFIRPRRRSIAFPQPKPEKDSRSMTISRAYSTFQAQVCKERLRACYGSPVSDTSSVRFSIEAAALDSNHVMGDQTVARARPAASFGACFAESILEAHSVQVN